MWTPPGSSRFVLNPDLPQPKRYSLLRVDLHLSWWTPTLDDCADIPGLVQDSASEALAAARAARTANATELRMLLEALAKKLYDEGGAERAQLVTRRGRQCLPVRRGQQGLLPSGGACVPQSHSAEPCVRRPEGADRFGAIEGDVLGVV